MTMDIIVNIPKQQAGPIVHTLLALAREHRKVCTSACPISLFPLITIVAQLLGRPLTADEFEQLT